MEGKKIRSYKDLQVWQDSLELVKIVYSLCALLPKEELYGLGSQIKRAVISIASNIAEGHSRQHRSEYRQFIYIAIGSLAEVETQLIIANEIGMLSSQNIQSANERLNLLKARLLTLAGKLS